MRSIIVTNKRVIYFNDNLFFAENEHEVPLRRITDVTVQKIGIMRNILNFGTLCFDASPTGEPTMRRSIPNVPKPERIAEAIASLLPPTVW